MNSQAHSNLPEHPAWGNIGAPNCILRERNIVLENRHAIVDAPSQGRSLGAELPSRQRAKRTNDPLADINRNTARGRRTADLARAFMDAAGNPQTPERQAAVIAAAELTVIAEAARAAALAGTGNVDLDQVIRVQGAADRAVRRLGIKPAAERETDTLADYLRNTYGGKAESDLERHEDETDIAEAAAAGAGESPACASEAAATSPAPDDDTALNESLNANAAHSRDDAE